VTRPASAATHRRLRDAMERLFNAKPQYTDAKLTKNNLWREAQLSRATMNRATDILAEWDARTGDSPAGVAARQRNDEIESLRSSLQAARLERRQLQDQLDAAATVIAALTNENAALRRQAMNSSPRITPLFSDHGR
jgi:predicted  nucleic acid-binding Zn-ribbon protein